MSNSKKSSTSTRKISWWSVVAIIFIMVIGILFIVSYAVDQKIIDYIIGSICLVGAVGLVIFSIIKTGKLLTPSSIGGVLLLSVGIYEFASGGLAGTISSIIAWFTFLMGIILFLIGIVMLALNAKKHLISGIIEIAGGAVMGTLGGLMLFPMSNPVLGSEFVWLISGIILILLSILLIVNIFFPTVFSTKVAKRTKVEE